jgi:hypothetical protein
LLVQLATAALAGCDHPAERGDLAGTVSEAEAAWVSMDAPGLRAAVDAARALVPCLGEALAPSDVAAFWRAVAYDAYARGDIEGAISALRAARSLEPARRPTVAAQHPLSGLWSSAAGGQLGSVSVPTPVGGRVTIDGRDTDQAPLDRAYVVQRFDADGRLVLTLLHPPGGDPPPPAAVTPIQLTELTPVRTGHPVRWLVAGLLVEAVAVGLAGYAVSLNDDIRTAPDLLSLERAFERQQFAGYTSYGLFGGGAALATVGLAVALDPRHRSKPEPEPADRIADP